MRSLSASEILEIWERGLGQSPIQRALGLLSPVHPEATWDSLAELSIGQRDAKLFAIRQQLFGAEIAAMADCPQCGGQLDLTLNAAEIRSAGPTDPEDTLETVAAGHELRFRLPNSEDVAAVINRSDGDGNRRSLVERCLLSARLGYTTVGFEELPDEALDAMSERMASADPLADIQLSLACPSCSHRWRAAFDIVSFLWREIENAAGRLLRDVHTLATAYGWHEKDILSLSSVRREYYLALMGT